MVQVEYNKQQVKYIKDFLKMENIMEEASIYLKKMNYNG